MNIGVILLYETIVLVIGLGAIAAFSFFYARLLSGYKKLEKDREKLKKELEIYGNRIEARSKEQVKTLIDHSQHLSDDLKKELTKLLDAQLQKESGAYTDVLEHVSDSVIKETNAQVHDLVSGFGKELAASERELSTQVQGIIAQAHEQAQKIRSQGEEDAAAHVARVEQELSAAVYPILQETIVRSMGKLLTRPDHDAIVLHQLQDAIKRVSEKSAFV